MRFIEDEDFLRAIKDTQVDIEIFKIIACIKEEQEKLVFLYKYYKRMVALVFDEEKSVACFNKTLKDNHSKHRVESFKELLDEFNKILDKLDFRELNTNYIDDDVFSQEVQIYDDKKQKYKLICNYEINEVDLNSLYKIDLNYSLSKNGIVLVTSISVNLSVKAYEGGFSISTDHTSSSDINHYLIKSELEDIYLRLKDLNIKYLYFYNSLRKNCFIEQ